MKYIVLLGDGMADIPIDKLGGKTPLEVAYTPNMDKIAKEGTLGLINTIPSGFSPGSDVAILSVLGYDPSKSYSGRGPLEAANMGIHLGDEDVAFRCNLVTINFAKSFVMEDFTSGHISSSEARQIIEDIHNEFGTEEFQFYPGVSYRHLLVWRNGLDGMKTTPPHDITGKEATPFLPSGEGSEKIKHLITLSQKFLKDHPVNKRRFAQNKKMATSIWPWGQGRLPKLEKLTNKYGLKGGMISAVDLLFGIGIYAGLEAIRVEGATGYIDTNYSGKANGALNFLENSDFIFVHVEAPDEMGHEGNLEGKIKAIEDFDEKIVGTVLNGAYKLSPFRIMILSDHPTPISLKTHTSDPSPFAIFSSIPAENLKNGSSFDESAANIAGIKISPGHLLLDYFIRNWSEFIEKYRKN